MKILNRICVRNCLVCKEFYSPTSVTQKYCSKKCCDNKHWNTDGYYSRISGKWTPYLKRLANNSNRKNVGLTHEVLFRILEWQKYQCALTGVMLTCNLTRGTTWPTNASVDRIRAGEEYSESNVQLVCSVINQFRRDVPVSDFIEWCRKVVNYANN